MMLRRALSNLPSPLEASIASSSMFLSRHTDVAMRHAPTHRVISRPPPLRVPPLRTPPPIGSAASSSGTLNKLPPAPPLPGKLQMPAAWRGPQEILSMFIEHIPTFYVPLNCVGATLDEESRALVKGRGKFVTFLRKYRFFFDVRTSETGFVDVKLRDDVNHPKRGAADEKYMMTDVGERRTFTVRPEFIVNMEPIELASENVLVRPPQAPPSVHVAMEERVPVVDRLQTLIPPKFTLVEEVEEKIPEDVLFHPYFDCQGGLPAIASKFPELFQVVEGFIRLRPAHLAPLATDELTLATSLIPSVAEKVTRMACGEGVPQWVPLTSIYETLTPEEKRAIKRQYKSFAGYLRAHGRSVAISQDTLKVSKWVPPTSSAQQQQQQQQQAAAAAKAAVAYTQTHVINELFEKFPRFKTLNVIEMMQLLPDDLRGSTPKRVVPWLAQFKSYFVVENPEEINPELVRVRRATDTIPLDLALAMYPCIPDDGISQVKLVEQLPASTQVVVQRIGLPNVILALSDWLELVDGDVFRKKTEAELENAIQSEESKRRQAEDEVDEAAELSFREERDQRLIAQAQAKNRFQGPTS